MINRRMISREIRSRRTNSRIRSKISVILSSLLCAALFCAALASPALALSAYRDGIFVYDEADVIPAEVEEEINTRAAALEGMTGVRVVTVCVASIEDKQINAFARELFFEWGLGEDDSRSVMILFATENRTYWTVQSVNFKDDFTDADLRRINNDCIEPDFASGKFADSAKKGFEATLEKVESIYSVDISNWKGESAAETENSGGDEKSSGFSLGAFFKVLLIIVLVAAGVIAALTVFAFLRRPRYVGSDENKRRHYRTDRGAYVGMPEKSDIERARAREARMRNQNAADSRAAQTRYPQGQRPQGQRPQGQYPQGQRPQGQRPQGQYPQGQRPQGQRPQGQAAQNRPRAEKRHEHPTVYPDRAPYINQNGASSDRSGGGRI